ncbi:rhomboid family intramembrane serine protease [Psychroserpens sp.]|uniref:rhomboid family intramembrane serine protease n=1 Tax=Psychroserpens sp. TaxID=2020870 RepID=UPI001B095BF8|nr:rhomboid family intramembrane serine protease [Psychroserpens sp.]MBO6606206.1 rhomboid family intramembrane serine protease [Psychroserpens sp.]MBO6652422.1 rhomboid family intramembrane serine protease [Psychroserpens sp.]MBO6681806.1 rhomboid family intramembrane serine protease [Psychroserpens sp.]MBO6749581.1 rhomboid family intramembrane serine protease [Psychroserpens sp.]MBO6913974.1 rhomboid family intramembrane serine protease [Psychroserpens sp.]
MSNDSPQFRYSTGVIAYPVFFVLLIWIVFWMQVRFFPWIKRLGVYPQEPEGLLGIFTSPFIHADIEHLYHNSIPLFILSMALFYFYRKISWKVIIYGILLSGLFTWIIGRPANHIGASGLVYVLVSFIFFKGIFAKHYRLVALSLIIVFLYGSMVWYAFPVKDGMSWEGHLGGLISGLVFAIIFRKAIAKPERYVWQQPDYNEEDDPFLKHFDENGNFIENLEPEVTEEELLSENNRVNITYTFKEKKD